MHTMTDPLKTLSIDRNSYQPAYAQIVDAIRQQIALGGFPPGSRLPSESQLCRQFQVSSVTVRRAVSVLVDQGVVATTQGKGSYVKPIELSSTSFQLNELQTIFDDQERTLVKLLFARIIPATPDIVKKLPVAENDRVIHIRRLISNNEHPLIYHHQYMVYDPAQPIVEAELDLTSLGGLFEGRGKSWLKKGMIKLKPALLNEDEALHLKGEAGRPAFSLEHTFFDLQDRQVSWGWFVFFDERLEFGANVGVWGNTKGNQND